MTVEEHTFSSPWSAQLDREQQFFLSGAALPTTPLSLPHPTAAASVIYTRSVSTAMF